MKNTYKLVETETVTRDYGFNGCNAIILINGKKHLIRDGYGESGLAGGAVRWEHGTIFSLMDDDTLETLNTFSEEDGFSPMDALSVMGDCGDRSIVYMSGSVIANIANLLNL